MAFFKPVKKAEALSEQSGGGSAYISKSGIYDVTLDIVSVAVNDHGARSINFNVSGPEDGMVTTFYGLRLDNNDGSNNFQAEIFNKLVVIADLDTVSDPEEQEHNLGKDNTPTTLAVLEDFTGMKVKIRVQEEYSINNRTNEITKRMNIKNFYREDGAAAIEIVNDTEIGVQLAKDEKYAANVTYKDGLTAESVQEWKDSKASGNKPATSKSTAVTKNKPAGSLFN